MITITSDQIIGAKVTGGWMILKVRIPIPQMQLEALPPTPTLKEPFVPKWMKLPDISAEYEAGATLLEIANRYSSDTASVSKKLRHIGVKIRNPGYKGCKNAPPRKLNDDQIKWAIETDQKAEISQAEIGRQLGVTREYIRQLCKKAGHEARGIQRSQMTIDGARVIQMERKRAATAKMEKIEQLSKLYRDGADFRDIARAAGLKPTYAGGFSLIGRIRTNHPELVPHRQPNHHKLKHAV